MGVGIVISLALLFIGITILVVIHVCIVGRTFRRDRGGGGTHHHHQGQKKVLVGGNIDDLKNLPCFDYVEPQKGCNSLVDCAVCLESFKAGDSCRLLPKCSHSFHVQCIDSWILKTPFCPICRAWVHERVMVTTPSTRVMREEETLASANVEIEIT